MKRRALEALCAVNALVLIVWANLRFMLPHPAMLQHWDEAYAIAFARRMLDGHNLPYVDGVSQRGPLFYWIVALAVKIFGVGTWMPARALMLLFMPLTALFGFLSACVAGRRLAGAVMALAYFVLCTGTYEEGAAGYGLACNSEHFANVFSMAALLALTVTLRRSSAAPPRAGLALAGALVMLSGLSKQVGLVVALPMGLWVLAEAIRRRTLPVRTRQWMVGSFAVGFLVPFLIVLARFAEAGELWALYYYPFAYNYAIYVPAMHGAARAKFWHDLLFWLPEPLIVLVGVSGASAAFLAGQAHLRRGVHGLARWYAANGFDVVTLSCVPLTLYTSSMAMRVWGHYYTQVFPWAALAGGVLLDRASGRGPLARDPRRSLLARAAVLVPLVLVTNVSWLLRSRELDASSEVREAFATRDWPVCRFLDAKTRPNDSIFIWGFSPAPYVACNRRAASRYVFTIYPAGVVPWVVAPRDVEESRVVPGSRETLLADLRKDPPAAILDVPQSLLGRSMMDYDFLRTYVAENYCETFDHELAVRAWLRKPPGGCAPNAEADAKPQTRTLRLYRRASPSPEDGDLEARAPLRDSRLVASQASIEEAERGGYVEELPTENEPGAVFTEHRPGTSPLFVSYDEGTHSVTSRTYRGPVHRVEGYIYTEQHPDTLPLDLYYNPRSHDHLTTARPDVATLAEEAGYVWVRLEGFVPRR